MSPVERIHRLSICALLAVLGGAACSRNTPDPAFATPRATVMTLLRTHRLDRAPGAEVERQVRGPTKPGQSRFGDVDKNLMARCFEDFDPNNPVEHGLVGFVIGALAAKRDKLHIEIEGETARVKAGDNARIVLHLRDDGWKISLRDSVPERYRDRMESLFEQARQGGANRLLERIENNPRP